MELKELENIKAELIAHKSKTYTGVYVIGTIHIDKLIDAINQTIEHQKLITRWYAFLQLMAQRSSWGPQIRKILDEYLYGTADEKVQAAAKMFLKRSQLHDDK